MCSRIDLQTVNATHLFVCLVFLTFNFACQEPAIEYMSSDFGGEGSSRFLFLDHRQRQTNAHSQRHSW